MAERPPSELSTAEMRKFAHKTWKEAWLQLPPLSAENPESKSAFAAFAKTENPRFIEFDVFDRQSAEAFPGLIGVPEAELTNTTSLWGRSIQGVAQGGVLAHAISAPGIKPVRYQGRTLGIHFEDENAQYCFLGDLIPSDRTAHHAAQTEEVFLVMERVLHGIGMEFRDVVRTWFYLDDILSWYGDFNCVRTAFFESRGIFGGIMPASTGIGAANRAGTALVAKLVAVRAKGPDTKIRAVESPLQCDAFSYGSAFSRALSVDTPGTRRLYVSGTASIEPGGKTIHVGDTIRQIELTMEVVGAILECERMHWNDVTRAIGYFRHAQQVSLWQEFCRHQQFPKLPIVAMQADVCRDDLLFELELDAVGRR